MPPALFPAIAILAGAVAGTFLELPSQPALAALPLLCAVAVTAWSRRFELLTVVCTSIAFCLSAAVLAADARGRALHPPLRSVLDEAFGGFAIDTFGPEQDHDPMLTRAVLREDTAARDDYVSLRVDVIAVQVGSRWRAAEGGVSLTVSGPAAANRARDWRAGRVIEAPVTFRRAARYLNDGVPDFERQLALDGTTLLGSVKSALLVDVVRRGSAFHEWAAGVRERVRRAVSRRIGADGAPAAIVTAVLIGDRAGLTDEIVDRLQRAGTYHVIAISGGNIAVLAGVVLAVLALAGIRGRVAALVTIAALIVYANVATSGPSVWRATLMAVIYLAARALDHRAPPWQATTLAAALMAVTAPLDVRSAGFILTFGATAALLESARWIARRWSSIRTERAARHGHSRSTLYRSVPMWIGMSIAASLAVEVVLAPVSAQSFSRVTLAGPVLNLVAVPAMAIAQVSGLLVVVADAWPAIAEPAGWVAATAASAIVESARLVDIAPGLSWRVPPPGFPILIAYYAVLLTAVSIPRRRIRLGAVVLAVFGLLRIASTIGAGDPEDVDGMRLTMLDVGQGEALLLESGAARLQIDAGGAPFGGGGFDVGARVLAPALWARGVHAVDALLLTHGDPDHIGGARILFGTFGTRQLWEGVVVPKHLPSREVREAASLAGASVAQRRAGESFPWGRARIRVMHPPRPDWERPRVRNDDSVVLEVACGDVALLLTGDISAEVEREIAPLLTPAPTRVLKVAHHGSRTSSSAALLEHWRPQIALISAGRGNTFGHPTPEVLERLEAIGARIYRTDRDGEITVDTDCRNVAVRTFNEKH